MCKLHMTYGYFLLIHEADLQSRLLVIIVFVYVVRSKQNKFKAKTIFTTGEIVGLAEWILMTPVLFYLFLYG